MIYFYEISCNHACDENISVQRSFVDSTSNFYITVNTTDHRKKNHMNKIIQFFSKNQYFL